MTTESWFVLPKHTRKIARVSPSGAIVSSEETYHDFGDMAGLITVGFVGSVMILAFSGFAAYKQYLSEFGK